MPKPKSITQTNLAEVVSFESLKVRREAARATLTCSIGVIEGEAKKDDIVLCELEDGSLGLAYVSAVKEETLDIMGPYIDNFKAVLGRVVIVR